MENLKKSKKKCSQARQPCKNGRQMSQFCSFLLLSRIYASWANPGNSVVDCRVWRVLLEGDASFVRGLQLVGFADSFAVDQYLSVWAVVEDLEQEPLLIVCDGSARRGDAVETSRWVRAVGGVEALDLDAAISVIEEHAAVAVDDCLDPGLQFIRALKLLLGDSRSVVAFAGERIVLDLPVRVSVRAKALHAGGE